ncbi:MAG TPA: thioesterase domain-containing protein, partial [Segetibacter sp.]|nr:thioesterase domain-containing protein [Segetibacter sp.]
QARQGNVFKGTVNDLNKPKNGTPRFFRTEESNCLIPIRKGKNKLPLYIVCGGGGTVFKFKKMVDLLDPSQPVFGLQQPTDLKSLEEFPETVEGIAEKYVGEILRDNPNGPYALSGHCSGGLIAYEMRKQLEAMGKEVKMLAMFDTVAPLNNGHVIKPNSHNLSSSVRRFVKRTQSKLDFELFLLRRHTKDAVKYKLSQLKSVIAKAYPKTEEALVYEVYKKLTRIIENAHRSYRLAPYKGKMYIYFAKEHYQFSDMSRQVNYKKIVYDDSIKNRWLKYADSVSIFDIEGEHSTMFDPQVGGGKELAELLQQHLDQSNIE